MSVTVMEPFAGTVADVGQMDVPVTPLMTRFWKFTCSGWLFELVMVTEKRYRKGFPGSLHATPVKVTGPESAANAGVAVATMTAGTAQAVPATTVRRETPF